MSKYYLIAVFLIYYFILQDLTYSIRLLEVRVPNYVVKGSSAHMECVYDLDGEALYSVKWYKDGNEFYRYLPRDIPPAQTFLLPGVKVDLHNSSDAIVTLKDVNLQSAGRFRCEVSGEAPSFQTVTEHSDMIVVSLPDQGPPKIFGSRPRYQIGDWVRVNCSAGRSKPAVQLTWYINNEHAEPHTLRKYETILYGREGLETAILGLQFRVEQHHFRNGDMKLKCVASLSSLYWRSNEESVEGDRPQKAPVLGSIYASNSRADPVQASKTDSIKFAPTLSLFLLLLICTLLTSSFMEQMQLWHFYMQQQQKQQISKKNHNQKEQQNEKEENIIIDQVLEEEEEKEKQQRGQQQAVTRRSQLELVKIFNENFKNKSNGNLATLTHIYNTLAIANTQLETQKAQTTR